MCVFRDVSVLYRFVTNASVQNDDSNLIFEAEDERTHVANKIRAVIKAIQQARCMKYLRPPSTSRSLEWFPHFCWRLAELVSHKKMKNQ